MSSDFAQPLVRLASGVVGLDQVLAGGFFVGGVYLVEGAPGAGKTILANQLCFHHAKAGARVLYVTILAESHSRLLQHLQSLEFFEPSVIPERLTYVSGFSALEDEGLKGLIDLIRRELRAHRATVVVLDGFATVGESAESDRDFKRLVHELQIHAGLAKSTFFLLSSGISASVQPVHTMVDGVVRLADRTFGVHSERELLVQKFRGSDYLRGTHTFGIDDRGVEVYPRIEATQVAGPDTCPEGRLATGITRLDAMLRGGFLASSTTMLLGPTGVGKTCLGYRFLGESTPEEPGLLFSFYETPARAVHKAEGIGAPFGRLQRNQSLEIVWAPPVETTLDGVGNRILEAVQRRGVRRLFVDGFNALLGAAPYPERVPQFFAALGQRLRALGVTTAYAAELHDVFAPKIVPPSHGVSPLLENLIVMRFVEEGPRVHRLISVLKQRDSDSDSALREFTIGPDGIAIADALWKAEALITGVARSRGKATPAEVARKKRPLPRARKRSR